MGLRAARFALALLVIAAAAVGIDNLDRPLANPDEGRYSEISREMAATGDWVTPRLNGIKYFEKPPLQYWAGAASFRLLGESEQAARLYTGLAALLTVLVAGLTAARLWGSDEGVAAMVALVACPYFLALGGVVTLDMGLTLWTTAAFCAWLLAEESEEPARKRRLVLAAWAAAALAVLSKGLVGLLLPAAAVAIACALRRDFSPLARLEWLRGAGVFVAIAAPWFVAVSLANPEFARFFFVHEHFERFLTTAHRRDEPWWYFLPIATAGVLPWLFAVPAAVVHGWRAEARAPGARPLRFAIVWSAFVIAFFSLSGSKLPTYILPAFPAIALVLGRYLVTTPPSVLARWTWPLPLLAIALAFAAWRLPDGAREEWTRALYLEARPWVLAAAGVLLVASALAPVLLARNRRWLGILALASGSVVMVGCLENAYERLSPRQSGLASAQLLKPLLGPGTRLYSVGIYDQTLPFYLGRTLTLVDYVDEFEMGLKHEPGRDLRGPAFDADWLRPGDALAIMHPHFYESMRDRGLPMQVLHQDPRRVLVRKP